MTTSFFVCSSNPTCISSNYTDIKSAKAGKIRSLLWGRPLHMLENVILVAVLAFWKVFLTGGQDFHRFNMVLWCVSLCRSWTITLKGWYCI